VERRSEPPLSYCTQRECKPRLSAEGKYVGRPENKRRNNRIATMLAAGTSYNDIRAAHGVQSLLSPRSLSAVGRRRKGLGRLARARPDHDGQRDGMARIGRSRFKHISLVYREGSVPAVRPVALLE
jgi:hypothetical protein